MLITVLLDFATVLSSAKDIDGERITDLLRSKGGLQDLVDGWDQSLLFCERMVDKGIVRQVARRNINGFRGHTDVIYANDEFALLHHFDLIAGSVKLFCTNGKDIERIKSHLLT